MQQNTSSFAVSSGYSSSSGTTLNHTISSQSNIFSPIQNNKNLPSSSKMDNNNPELSAIVNSFEKEVNLNRNSENTGFASYVTGGQVRCGSNLTEMSENSNSFDPSSYNAKNSNVAKKETITDDSRSFDPATAEKLSAPFVNDEKLAQEVLAKAGPAFTYQRSEYKNDIGSLANEIQHNSSFHGGVLEEFDENGHMVHRELPTYSSSSSINQDPSPIRITKPNNQQSIVYKQQVNIRYLQPPTPPPPAPIIIREKQTPIQPKMPPIIIRQTAPAPSTPAPLIIREKAPTPPPTTEPTIIERPVPAPPAAPRQVIIERVPAPPAKPRQIIYEKWLPYKSTNRPVIVQKLKQQNIQETPKNIIIEYEKMNAVSIRTVVEEGVFRVDPTTYQSYLGNEDNSEIRYVERITDLPVENSRILEKLNMEPSNNLNQMNSKFANNIDCNATHNLNSERESYNNFLTQFLSSPSGASESNEGMNQQQFSSNSRSMQFNSNQNSNNNSSFQNSEYETITTSVPESLANKIIAEAQAAGAIKKTTNC